jgi:acetyl esterase
MTMLDLQLDAMMQQARAAGAPDLCDLPPAAARGMYRHILASADRPPANVSMRQHGLAAASKRHALPLRVYTPLTTGPHGVTVYFHGGGYVLGDLDGYDSVCRQLCEDSDSVVVTVDYRLAPEHPFPAAHEDAWDTLVWAREQARAIGGDANRMAVAGDSAGAVLAAACAIQARDAGGPALAFQALIYPPAAGGHGSYASHTAHAAGPTLTLRTMEYFGRHYWGETGRSPDWRGAPLLAQNLSRLPPALVVLAAHDPIRDEGFAYAQALMKAGTACTLVEYHGLAHGFISMAGALPAARAAQLQIGQAIAMTSGCDHPAANIIPG